MERVLPTEANTVEVEPIHLNYYYEMIMKSTQIQGPFYSKFHFMKIHALDIHMAVMKINVHCVQQGNTVMKSHQIN